jgi:acetyl coenzyme A synthetase (ADP forming)-like protein
MASLDPMFYPRSVAVVGASKDATKLGHTVLANILGGGYKGELYPINPTADSILGLKTYPSLTATEGPIDLAVIVTPAKTVPGILQECSKKRVRACIVVSGGFREVGVEGEQLEEQLREVLKASGLRLLGPNCQGMNNPHANLCASWPLIKTKGPIAIVSHSGTVGGAVQCWADDDGIGVSKFVGLGNRVDLNELDLLEFLGEDETARVVVLYLEGVAKGREFIELAQKISRSKPIVMLKGGRTESGAKAAMSHTRSLAGRYAVLQAALKRSGVVLVDSIEALYDASKILSFLTLPEGRRILIITNSGGAGILAADCCEDYGLKVPPLSETSAQRLKGKLPGPCIIANPLDLTSAGFDPEMYALCVKETATEPVDMYMTIFGDPIKGAAQVVKRLVKETQKPIVVTYLGGADVEKEEKAKMHAAGIPVFPSPERAIRAVRALAEYAEWRRFKADRYLGSTASPS